MSNSFSLDDIRAAADAKYGSTFIAGVELLNPIRLPKEDRDHLVKTQKQTEGADAEDVDQQELFEETIRTVAKDKRAANNLLKEIGGDLGVLAEIVERYNEGTQAGEA